MMQKYSNRVKGNMVWTFPKICPLTRNKCRSNNDFHETEKVEINRAKTLSFAKQAYLR